MCLVHDSGNFIFVNDAVVGNANGGERPRHSRRSSLDCINATQELPHATYLELTALALHGAH